jgi:hypothetical protein
VAEPEPTLLEKRLDERVDKKWGSFSWLTLRALVSSANDAIGKGAPRLVNDMRGRWVSARRSVVDDRWSPDWVVKQPGARSFLILGDPGEQDASQYVVAPALEEHNDVDFMLICSDVIYPSGDVNDYVDGFYIPYRRFTPKVYALPGNHDWYDGLSGFMWHFCGTEALPLTSYMATSYSLRERLLKRLWRRPAAPRRDLLNALRAERAGFQDESWRPLQPGPYFAIDTGRVLLVCIDTGIKGEIDREQGEWLLRVSQAEQDKVLVTGKPLLVNKDHKPCPIAEVSRDGPLRSPTGREFGTVDDIVRCPEHRYVAAIGGDIHNHQDYEVEIEEGGVKRPFRYVVSGGGGAYMSATHTISGKAGIKWDAEHSSDAPQAIHLKGFRCYPTCERSLIHFSGRLVPAVWRLVWTVLAIVAGFGLATGAAAYLGPDADDSLDLALLCAAVALAAWFLVVGPALRFLRRKPWPRVVRLAVATLAGGVLGLAGHWLAPGHFETNAIAAATLTAGGSLIALLLRVTHWWRPRRGHVEHRRQYLVRWLGGLALWLGLGGAGVVVALTQGESRIGAAVGAIAFVGAIGWILRMLGRWREGVATASAYAAQFAALLLIIDRWPLPESAHDEFVALLAAFLVAPAAVAIASWLVRGVVALLAMIFREKNGPKLAFRAAFRQTGSEQFLLIVVLLGGAVWGLTEVLHGRDSGRAIAAAGAMLLVPVVAIVVVDYVRRLSPLFWRAWLVGAIGLVVLALALTDAEEGWFLRAFAAAAAILAVGVLGTLITHLTFLRAFALVLPWPLREASRLRNGTLSCPEAKQALEWRDAGDRGQKLDPVVHRIVDIAYPGSDNPRGPL